MSLADELLADLEETDDAEKFMDVCEPDEIVPIPIAKPAFEGGYKKFYYYIYKFCFNYLNLIMLFFLQKSKSNR